MPAGLRDKYQYCTCASMDRLRSTGYTTPDNRACGRRRRVRAQLSRSPIGGWTRRRPRRPPQSTNRRMNQPSRAERRRTSRGGAAPPPRKRDPMVPIYIALGAIVVLVFIGFGISNYVTNRSRAQITALDVATPTAGPVPTTKPVQPASRRGRRSADFRRADAQSAKRHSSRYRRRRKRTTRRRHSVREQRSRRAAYPQSARPSWTTARNFRCRRSSGSRSTRPVQTVFASTGCTRTMRAA